MSESTHYNKEVYTIIGKCLVEAILNASPLSNDFRLGELDEKKSLGNEEVGYVEFSFEIPVEISCAENAQLSYDEINNSIIKKWIHINAQDINKRLIATVNRYLNARNIVEEYDWDMSSIDKASTGRSQEDFSVEIDNLEKKVRFLISIPSIKGNTNSK